MKHEFDAKLLAEPRAAELARRAAAILDVDTAGSVIHATAEWRLPTPGGDPGKADAYGNDYGPAVVEVVIRDPYGVEVTRFIRERDLVGSAFPRNVSMFWDDLLAAHMGKTARRLLAELADPAELATP